MKFEPDGEANKINQYIKDQDIKPQAILLTHVHFDHIGAVDEVRNKWSIPVYIH
ncbi:MBL fold metallo-hydrolase [Bacillus sp. S10(2024)]|uniref:MBL fold metallo-hydrolase n=1 Tax=Bacillus sp. S10(2024) TaxID=3162886 RepID=UPI003D23A137